MDADLLFRLLYAQEPRDQKTNLGRRTFGFVLFCFELLVLHCVVWYCLVKTQKNVFFVFSASRTAEIRGHTVCRCS